MNAATALAVPGQLDGRAAFGTPAMQEAQALSLVAEAVVVGQQDSDSVAGQERPAEVPNRNPTEHEEGSAETSLAGPKKRPAAADEAA